MTSSRNISNQRLPDHFSCLGMPLCVWSYSRYIRETRKHLEPQNPCPCSWGTLQLTD